LGGCSTPISALAVIQNKQLVFTGNVLSTDGKEKFEIEKIIDINEAAQIGRSAGEEILSRGADKIVQHIRNAAK
jgi:hydroxymethylbilane synthase